MEKFLLALILSIMSSNVVAEWLEVDTSSRVGLTAYADPATISKSGSKAEMWVLYDYKTVSNKCQKAIYVDQGAMEV